MPKINASTAGMANAVIPIVATAVAVIFYGASIRVVAIALVIASILIAEAQEKKQLPEINLSQEDTSHVIIKD